jgi:hypothetical protein
MGPVDPAQVPKLTEGWDAVMGEVAHMLPDSERVRSEVMRRVRAELTAEVIDGETA